jgi:LysR family transcriptional regulator, carnitine catabolism transcriptional activator
MLLEHLRSFLTVAKHHGLREASTELHLTQSAVSKRLQSLQEELGVKLYRRSAQGIELTEAGRMALTKIEPILKQINELQQSFQAPAQPKKEPVVFTVAGAFSLAAEFLPSMIARFEKTHAGVSVNCHTGSSEQIQQMLRDGTAELGLSTYPPMNADIGAEPFRVQTLAFFVSTGHPLASRRHLTLSDVLAYPLVIRSVMGGPTWTHEILRQLSERGFKYKVALECNGPLQVKEAVARNVGVGFSYKDNLKADVARKRFVILKGVDFQFNTLSYILFSKKRGLPPAAHEFLQLLRQAKQIPKNKNLEEITPLSQHRFKSLPKKTRKLIWTLYPLLGALTDVLALHEIS